MAVAAAQTIALQGTVGHLVEVQADVSQGVVGMSVVGRVDSSVQEARDRVRMATVNSRLEWPSTRRVVVLLTPADLPKSGTHFDLAIAVAIQAASGQVPLTAVASAGFVGELTLEGRLRCVPGVLPMVLAASRAGIRRVFVPEPHAREASHVAGMEVIGIRSLGQVVAELRGEVVPSAPAVAPMSGTRLVSWRGEARRDEVDLADLDGLDEVKYAVEVAAAGGHHLLLNGPRGVGKTSLAERVAGILPDLTDEESLELMAVHSLAGVLEPGDDLIRRPPFAAPHHDASRASVLGGGSGRVRPGEISRAHAGVLFLDEFPLFRADVVEALRQPLESGEVEISRGAETAVFPARGMVVLAANPCPCGEYAPGRGGFRCRCSEVARRAYRAKLEGPVVDRVDIARDLWPVPQHVARDRHAVRETSAEVRERVAAARQRQAERYRGRSFRLNSQVPGHVLRADLALPGDAERLLDDALEDGLLSRRGAVRVHRLAWSVADLAGVERPGAAEVGVALALRLNEPLPAPAARRVG